MLFRQYGRVCPKLEADLPSLNSVCRQVGVLSQCATVQGSGRDNQAAFDAYHQPKGLILTSCTIKTQSSEVSVGMATVADGSSVDVTERLQNGVEVNAVDCSDEPFALQSLCMNCYENVSRILNLVPCTFFQAPHTWIPLR